MERIEATLRWEQCQHGSCKDACEEKVCHKQGTHVLVTTQRNAGALNESVTDYAAGSSLLI
jgi:hypothetical protein